MAWISAHNLLPYHSHHFLPLPRQPHPAWTVGLLTVQTGTHQTSCLQRPCCLFSTHFPQRKFPCHPSKRSAKHQRHASFDSKCSPNIPISVDQHLQVSHLLPFRCAHSLYWGLRFIISLSGPGLLPFKPTSPHCTHDWSKTRPHHLGSTLLVASSSERKLRAWRSQCVHGGAPTYHVPSFSHTPPPRHASIKHYDLWVPISSVVCGVQLLTPLILHSWWRKGWPRVMLDQTVDASIEQTKTHKGFFFGGGDKIKAPGASKIEQRKRGRIRCLGSCWRRAVKRGRDREEVRTENIFLRLSAMQASGEQKPDGRKCLTLQRW